MTKRASAPGADDSEVLAVLLRRVALQDQAGFEVLHRRTRERLRRVVGRILTQGNGAADALQDAYVRIWERAADFNPAKGFPMSWMATIARNRALDQARRLRPLSLEAMPHDIDIASETIDPLAARERLQQLKALIVCLEKLDEEKRTIFMLAYYHGMSRETLSRHFGKPVPTIKGLLRRSRRELRECLNCHYCDHSYE